MPQEFRIHELVLPEAPQGLRFDQALARALPQYSRARIKRWIDSGRVRLEGAIPNARHRVFGGERVALEAVLEAAPSAVEAQDIPLEIVHADRALLIVNKPAGLTVHPGAGQASCTMQNALLAYDPSLASVPRAGIVHRIDKETSGLLVVARTVESHIALTRAIAAHAVERRYLALCSGVLTAGRTIDQPIGRHRSIRTRMSVRADGRAAVTHIRVLERFDAHTLVQAELETGRTHQIRVHLAHIGHPIVGDPTYGGRMRLPRGASESLRAALQAFRRQALHAEHLSLAHPVTGRLMRWHVSPPTDFQHLLSALRQAPPA